jgi:heat shock protein HslJ
MFTTRHRTPTVGARRLVAASVVCAVALMSCGDDSTSSSSSKPAAADLNGRSFLSTKVEGQTLVDGTQVTLTFTADSLSAVAGCNTMVGGYTIEDGTLKVAALAQTMMACDPETTAQDVWVAALLSGGPALTLDGDELTVKGSDTTLTLGDRSKVADANALDGRSWDIVSLDTAQAPEGAYLSVADGRLYVATGCNRGFGDVTVTDTAIEVGPIALTRMACEDAINAWEQSLTVFLAGSLEYTVSGTDVTLTNGTQTLTLAEIPAT